MPSYDLSTLPTRSALPLLDLGHLPPTTLRTVARDTGAFLLVGHGIRPEVPAEVVDLARLFFSLPAEDKAAVAAADSEQFRGWTAFGTGHAVGWREQFDVGAELPASPGQVLVGPNRWPARVPALRDRTLWLQDRATEVARALLRQLAVGLGQPAEHFDDTLAGDPTTWTTLAREDRLSAAGPLHALTDAGLLALRWIDAQAEGLQLLADHRWHDVPATSGAFLVSIGEGLAEATDGYLRAASHRWLPASRERVTLTYAFDAPADVDPPHLELPDALREEWSSAA